MNLLFTIINSLSSFMIYFLVDKFLNKYLSFVCGKWIPLFLAVCKDAVSKQWNFQIFISRWALLRYPDPECSPLDICWNLTGLEMEWGRRWQFPCDPRVHNASYNNTPIDKNERSRIIEARKGFIRDAAAWCSSQFSIVSSFTFWVQWTQLIWNREK